MVAPLGLAAGGGGGGRPVPLRDHRLQRKHKVSRLFVFCFGLAKQPWEGKYVCTQGYPPKTPDCSNMKSRYFPSIILPSFSSVISIPVDQEYFSVLRNGRRFFLGGGKPVCVLKDTAYCTSSKSSIAGILWPLFKQLAPASYWRGNL